MTVQELIRQLGQCDPGWPICLDDGAQLYPVVGVAFYDDIPAVALAGDRDLPIPTPREERG